MIMKDMLNLDKNQKKSKTKKRKVKSDEKKT